MIEKHFTLDRNADGPDHKTSITPREFKAMRIALIEVEACLGDGKKRVMECERKTARRNGGEIDKRPDCARGHPGAGRLQALPRQEHQAIPRQAALLWSIEGQAIAVHRSFLIVSTDDEEMLISQVAEHCQISERPPSSPTDDASNEDVLRTTLRSASHHDWVVLLQPTSPLRTART
jgi:hypothetical protein